MKLSGERILYRPVASQETMRESLVRGWSLVPRKRVVRVGFRVTLVCSQVTRSLAEA